VGAVPQRDRGSPIASCCRNRLDSEFHVMPQQGHWTRVLQRSVPSLGATNPQNGCDRARGVRGPCRNRSLARPCKKRGHMSNRGPIRMEIGRFPQETGPYEELPSVSNGAPHPSPQVAAVRLRSDWPPVPHMAPVFARRARFPFESAPGYSYAPVFYIAPDDPLCFETGLMLMLDDSSLI